MSDQVFDVTIEKVERYWEDDSHLIIVGATEEGRVEIALPLAAVYAYCDHIRAEAVQPLVEAISDYLDYGDHGSYRRLIEARRAADRAALPAQPGPPLRSLTAAEVEFFGLPIDAVCSCGGPMLEHLKIACPAQPGPVCACGHDEDDHLEDQEVDLDGRPTGRGVFEYCNECLAGDRRGHIHPFQSSNEAAYQRGWNAALAACGGSPLLYFAERASSEGQACAECGQPEDGTYDATGGALLPVHPGLHPFRPAQAECFKCGEVYSAMDTYCPHCLYRSAQAGEPRTLAEAAEMGGRLVERAQATEARLDAAIEGAGERGSGPVCLTCGDSREVLYTYPRPCPSCQPAPDSGGQ